jgi:phosphate uptake regulator
MYVYPEKERRKIQFSGKSSCMITLPKRWVREMGLQQGYSVTITRQGNGSILVSADPALPKNEKREALLTFSTKDSPESVFRKIASLYVLGYDIIRVKPSGPSFTPSQRDLIATQVRKRLVGTEVIFDSRDSIALQVLLRDAELSVEHALKRMLLISTGMLKDATQLLETQNNAQAEEVIQRDDEVDRFCLYAFRQLNSSIAREPATDNALQPLDLLGYIQIARILERSGDNAVIIAREALESNKPLDGGAYARVANMSTFTSELLNLALLSLFKRDFKAADEVIDKSKSFAYMEADLLDEVRAMTSPDQRSLPVVVDSLRRMVDYSKDVAEIVLDLTVERVVQKKEEKELAAV